MKAVPSEGKVRLIGFAKFSKDQRTKFTLNLVPLRVTSDIVNFYTVMSF